MIDERGDLHLFFGYGDSQLIHENLSISQYLKKISVPKLPSPIKNPKMAAINHHSRNANLELSDKKINFHKFGINNESSNPMVSADLNTSPNMYSGKLNKIKSLKQGIYASNPRLNTDLHHEDFFHRRNSPNSRSKIKMSPKISTDQTAISNNGPELSSHFKSGIKSMYGSVNQSEEAHFGSRKRKYNF